MAAVLLTVWGCLGAPASGGCFDSPMCGGGFRSLGMVAPLAMRLFPFPVVSGGRVARLLFGIFSDRLIIYCILAHSWCWPALLKVPIGVIWVTLF